MCKVKQPSGKRKGWGKQGPRMDNRGGAKGVQPRGWLNHKRVDKQRANEMVGNSE